MYNDTTVIGRLTKRPELKTSENNKTYSYFTVADNQYYNGKKYVNYVSFIAFDNIATSLFKNFEKGDLVLVKGSLYTDKYDNKKNQTISKLVCRAKMVRRLAKHRTDDADEEFVIEEKIATFEEPISEEIMIHEK